jgi:hypothetical protein
LVATHSLGGRLKRGSCLIISTCSHDMALLAADAVLCCRHSCHQPVRTRLLPERLVVLSALQCFRQRALRVTSRVPPCSVRMCPPTIARSGTPMAIMRTTQERIHMCFQRMAAHFGGMSLVLSFGVFSRSPSITRKTNAMSEDME